VEREVPVALAQGDQMHLELHQGDFSTAQRVVDAINKLAPGAATAVDGRQIRITLPAAVDERVGFLAKMENLQVTPEIAVAKVIVNSRTGSVVMNRSVALDNFAVAHGNLSVAVGGEGGGVDIKQEGGGLSNVKAGSNLADVVKALNAIGATPLDLVAILQAMKAAGALRAELEII
jgi:flagellar P-ring protein precursor FlgI